MGSLCTNMVVASVQKTCCINKNRIFSNLILKCDMKLQRKLNVISKIFRLSLSVRKPGERAALWFPLTSLLCLHQRLPPSSCNRFIMNVLANYLKNSATTFKHIKYIQYKTNLKKLELLSSKIMNTTKNERQ